MKYIDFDCDCGDSTTMIHVPFKGADDLPSPTNLLEELYQGKLLDDFDTTIRAPLTVCNLNMNGTAKIPDVLCIRFATCAMDSEDVEESSKNLWAFLHQCGLKITWKNNNTGYVVGENALILDSWELDDGMC